MPQAAALPQLPPQARSAVPPPAPVEPGWRRHLYTAIALLLAALFVVVFFTGRIDAKHIALVAPRVGLQGPQLDALVPRVAESTGATRGTVRRIAYLLACSGQPTAATMEPMLRQAAGLSQVRRLTPREATLLVLGDSPVHSSSKPIKDC